MPYRRFLVLSFCFLSLFQALVAAAHGADWNETTAMDEYIALPEPLYSWEVLSHEPMNGVDSYTLNVSTVTWLDETKVSRSQWFNYLVVNVPHNLRHTDAAALWIEGGSNTGSPPGPDDLMVDFTNRTGAISGYLEQIPNQSIIFYDDPNLEPRTEDDLIAYTWRWFLDDPSDPVVLARFPMVKATVKAMDAMQEFTKQLLGEENVDLQEFMPAGGSKRGWVAWLIAAMDRRVFATVPVVLSCLNLTENLHHHYQSLGGWSFVFVDYYRQNITRDIEHPNMQPMMDHVDPYEYRERLTMPIMYIGGTGDEFFLPDDTHYWWDGMPQGNNYLYWVVNAEHSLVPHHKKIVDTMVGFWTALRTSHELPTVTWEWGEDETSGYIIVHTSQVPVSIIGFRAVTFRHAGQPNRRDFRLVTGTPPYVNPVSWLPSDVEQISETEYRFVKDKVENVWVGMVIEATFETPEDTFITLTTEVNIIPNTFPFEKCEGPEECKGTLV